MIPRRDFLLGGGAVAAVATAYGLKPHREVSLLKSRQLADIVPMTFGDWTSEDVGDPLALNPGTLSAKLYNQIVVRQYSQATAGLRVVMLLAHGEHQTDDLQLHRPEVCYPAFGFTLKRNEALSIDLGHGVTIPSRQILAEANSDREAIVYWSRMGEYLPSSAAEQRADRMRIAMQGIVADGVLCRFNAQTDDAPATWRDLSTFVVGLLGAMSPDQREVLIGAQRARSMIGGVPAGTVR